MVLKLGELSDEEIEMICQSPRLRKEDVFGPAERWYAAHQNDLAARHGGQWLMLNAADLTYVTGDTFEQACKRYQAQFGPTPDAGRPFFAIVIKPR